MALPIEQQGLYQDGNSIFENVHILGTLNVATTNEKIVVRSNGITIDNNDGIETLRIESDGRVGIHSSIPAATLDIRDVGSTGPGILISGCTGIEGDLAVQDGQILHVGHFNSDTNTFTERARIATDGRVLIGRDSTTSISTNAALTIENPTGSSATRFNLVNSGSSQPESTQIYSQNNDLAFVAGASERLRITSGGDVSITDGNLIMASGHGIDFSDTANSSGTMSSELFDDYEEGSFTPAYQTSNNNIGSITYDNSFSPNPQGRYTKIGRMVFFTLRLETDDISSVGTGTVDITGLPFTHHNNAHQRAVTHNIYSAAWTPDNAPSIALIQNNQTRLRLYQKEYNEDGVALPAAALNTGTNDNDIRITGMYEATS